MAKIKVGAPAVSRYHQIRRIFSSSDMPNLSDHDFSVPNYLLSVSGYMFLKSKNSSINDDIPTMNDEDEVDVDGCFSATTYDTSLTTGKHIEGVIMDTVAMDTVIMDTVILTVPKWTLMT